MDDKVYTFISDPKHKENLSGRVRAACVTCRRKKIKCSGEVPCNTCSEKGIVCEGLTDRKRPKSHKLEGRRSSETCTQAEQSQSAASSPGLARAEPLLQPLARLTTTNRANTSPLTQRPPLVKTNTTNSNSDSGYSSGQHSLRHETSFIEKLRLEGERQTKTHDVSPSELGFHDWNFGTSGIVSSNSSHHQDMELGSPVVKSRPRDAPWWFENGSRNATATSLISTAKMLEEQAESLRRLASRHESSVDGGDRRQKIALPVSAATETCAPPINYLPGGFDDMALLFGYRSTGLTPSTAEFASWLETNSDSSNALGFHADLNGHPASLGDATSMPNSAVTNWDHVLERNICNGAEPSSNISQRRGPEHAQDAEHGSIRDDHIFQVDRQSRLGEKYLMPP